MKIFNKNIFKKIFLSTAMTAAAFSPLAAAVAFELHKEEEDLSLMMMLIKEDLPEAYKVITEGISPKLNTENNNIQKRDSRAGNVVTSPKTIYVAAPLPAINFKDNSENAKAILDQYLQLIRGFERTNFTSADIKTMQDGILYISISVVMGQATPDVYSKQFQDAVSQFTNADNLKKIVDKKNGIGKITAQDRLEIRKPEVIMDVYTAGAFSAAEAATMGKPNRVGVFDNGTPANTTDDVPIFTWSSYTPYDENDATSHNIYKYAIQRWANSDRFSAGNPAEMVENNSYLNNFVYKIGQLDVAQMKDTKYFSLSIEDMYDSDANGIAGTQNISKEMEMIFTNAEDMLATEFGATGKFKTINDLLKADMIFIRDMLANDGSAFDLNSNPGANHGSSTYGEMKWADNIYLSRPDSTNSKIDIYFKVKDYHRPVGAGGSSDSYFAIEVADASKGDAFAQKFEFGILDHPYAQPIVNRITEPTWTANNNMFNGFTTGTEPKNSNVAYMKNQDPQWIISSFLYGDSTGYAAPGQSDLGDYAPRTWHEYRNGAFQANTNPGINPTYPTWRIYHSLSTWRTVTGSDVGTIIPNEDQDLQHLRFFMHPGTAFDLPIRVKKEDDTFIEKEYFEGGSNLLKGSFDTSGSAPEIGPREYVIDEAVFDKVKYGAPKDQVANVRSWDGAAISGASQREQYAKVDFFFRKGQVMFNPDLGDANESEMIFSTLTHGAAAGVDKLAYQRIFFTPPRTIGADVTYTGLEKIKFGSKSKNDTYYETIVSNVYGIWSGFREQGTHNVEVNYVLNPEHYNWYENNPDSQEYETGTLFHFSYDHYRISATGGLEFNEPLSEIYLEDETGNHIYDANGNPIEIPSTGQNVANKLVDYSYKLIKWSKDILQADIDRDENHYKINGFSEAAPFFKDKIENETIVYGPKIMEVAKVLYKYWKNQNLSSTESILLADINDLAEAKGVDFRVVGADIEGQGDGVNGPADATNPQDPYLRSLAIIYEVVSWYWADALIYLIGYEEDSFTALKGSVLSKHMGEYLTTGTGSNGGSIKISASILEKIPVDLMRPGQEGVELLTLGPAREEVAYNGGAEELQSLLDFINNNGLHEKYLAPGDAREFAEFYDILTVPETYLSSEKVATARRLIRLLDVIIAEVIDGNEDIKTFTAIINDILQTSSDSTTRPVDEIRKTVRSSIRLIINPNKTEKFKYTYFGITEQTNYIENIVIGSNIASAIKKYIELKDDELTIEEVEMLTIYAGKEAYTTTLITKVAINLKYYNLRLFLDKMLDKNQASSLVEEILQSNLKEIKDIDIPNSNQLLNAISNPDLIIQVVMMFIGFMLMMLSSFSVATSFKKNVRQKGKSMLVTRLIFISIFAVGILVAGIGALPMMAA